MNWNGPTVFAINTDQQLRIEPPSILNSSNIVKHKTIKFFTWSMHKGCSIVVCLKSWWCASQSLLFSTSCFKNYLCRKHCKVTSATKAKFEIRISNQLSISLFFDEPLNLLLFFICQEVLQGYSDVSRDLLGTPFSAGGLGALVGKAQALVGAQGSKLLEAPGI